MAADFLRRVLAHPLTASLQLDDPSTTELRKQLILSKPFLKAIYDEWYTLLANALPQIPGEVLELGSGGGYCSRYIPSLITSDVFFCSGVRMVADARRIPLDDGSLRAIVMTNVLHHMPDVKQFFSESLRCLKRGGKILMIEPWVTPWSRFVYSHLHHEPFVPEATDWSFSSTGPLSGANGALPWIILQRDRAKFKAEFPAFSIEEIRPFLPFRYLLSGGVAMRALMPGFTHTAWARTEKMLTSQMPRLGMFAFVTLQKRN